MPAWIPRAPALSFALCLFSCVNIESVLAQDAPDRFERLSIGPAVEFPYMESPLEWFIDQTNVGFTLVYSIPEKITLLYELTFGRWDIDPYPQVGEGADWFKQRTRYHRVPNRVQGHFLRFHVGPVIPLIALGDISICNAILAGYQKNMERWHFRDHRQSLLYTLPNRVNTNQVILELRLRVSTGSRLLGPALEACWCLKHTTRSSATWKALVRAGGLSLRAYLPLLRKNLMK